MNAACHRSLYGYQMRTALALAVESPHLAVTFLPLACTGATIELGILAASAPANVRRRGTGASCPGSVRGQLAELEGLMARRKNSAPTAASISLLLTVGANDILFSGLVANISSSKVPTARCSSGGGALASVEDATKVAERDLPGNFAKLRARIKPLVGGNLARGLT